MDKESFKENAHKTKDQVKQNIKKAKKTGGKAETCRLADCASCANAMCAGKGKEE